MKRTLLIILFLLLCITGCGRIPDKVVEGVIDRIQIERADKWYRATITTFYFEDGNILITSEIPVGQTYALHKKNRITLGHRDGKIYIKEIKILE
jgi:hypothetical protein